MKILRVLILGALAVSILFGIWKQIKNADLSLIRLGGIRESEPGEAVRLLKRSIDEGRVPGADRTVRAGFLCERSSGAGRDCAELFYDAQYAWAPDLLVRGDDAAFFVLDLPDEGSLSRFCQSRGLKVLARSGGIALAARSGELR